MRIIKKIINFKTNTFSVRMLIEPHSDDTWNIFNLLSVGDFIFGVCTRKINQDTLLGLAKTQKKKFNILLQVTKFDYDGDINVIRILGRNAKEN
jgi:protein pelota